MKIETRPPGRLYPPPGLFLTIKCMCIAKIPSHETLTKLRKVCEDKIINSDNVAVFNPIWENYKKYWDKIK